MRIADCSETLRSLLALLTLLLLFSTVYLIVRLLGQYRRGAAASLLPLFALDYLVFQCFCEMTRPTPKYRTRAGAELAKTVFPGLPVWIVLLLLCTEAFLVWIAARNLMKWESRHLSANSVKESFDILPNGICCYTQTGRIVFSNRTCESICREFFGSPLRDGRLLAEKAAKTPAFELGGHCYYWEKSRFSFEGEELNLITAVDVTEEEHRRRELEEKRNELQKANEELVTYNKDIIRLVADKERLRAEMKIHNGLGSLLIAISNTLSGKSDEPYIREKLAESIDFLLSEDDIKKEYQQILEIAGKFGVKIRINGALPTGDLPIHIFSSALHECFTNLLKHAHGNALTVEVRQGETDTEYSFINNGEQPKKEIREGGGLSSLRSLTEQNGGRMRLDYEPSFAVVITLPKGAESYAL